MIETSGLTKRFDDILAVDHISAKATKKHAQVSKLQSF